MLFSDFRSGLVFVTKRLTRRSPAFLIFVLMVGMVVLSLNFGAGYRPAKAAPPADCTGVVGIPMAECNVLIALYTQTNGAVWTNNSGWTTLTPCITPWHGITCTLGSVTGISLGGNNLVGTIPATLNNLSNLVAIDMQTNTLTGAIPSLVGLINLQTLKLGSNQLTGTIPALAGLANLNYFNLSGNQLSGTIPALTGLTNLTNLNLTGNQLTGSIPALTGLINLGTLDLHNNQLTGSIPVLTGLTNLSDLVLQNNQLSGSIPSFTGLTSLTNAYLFSNQLTGTIPALTGLTSLINLYLYNNQLTGSIPALTGLTSLTNLYLYNNQLTGTIPALNSLASLTKVHLYNNQLTGTIPALTGLTNLINVYLNNNQLTGTIPALTGLTNLINLDFSSNQLTGAIPALTGLTNLSYLALFNNQLTGTIPALTSLTSLQYLLLNSNQFTGNAPDAPPSVTYLDVSNNLLNGTIPASLTLSAIPTTPQQLFLCGTGNSLTPLNGAVNTYIAAHIPGWTGQCTATPTSTASPTATTTAISVAAATSEALIDDPIEFDYTASQTTVIAVGNPGSNGSGGNNVALDVTLHNVSSKPVTGLVLREQVQPALRIIGITSTAGTPTRNCDQITVVIGTLLPGQTALLTVNTQVSDTAAFAPNSSDVQPVMYTYIDQNDAFSRSRYAAAPALSLVNVGSATWGDQHVRTKAQIVRVLRPSGLPTTGEHPAESTPSPLLVVFTYAIGICGLLGFGFLFVTRKRRARSY